MLNTYGEYIVVSHETVCDNLNSHMCTYYVHITHNNEIYHLDCANVFNNLLATFLLNDGYIST